MLIAFHNKKEVKAEYLARVKAHQKADEIVKGQYWKGGKGCAVGCTIHGSSHAKYETELGIPMTLAYLEDRIFENLPNDKAKKWPLKFLNAVKPGADLSLVTAKFMVWLLEDEVSQHFDAVKFPDVAKVSAKVIELYKKKIAGEKVSDAEWQEAARAACFERMADKLIELLKSAPMVKNKKAA